MKRWMWKSALQALCATALLVANPQGTDAGLIPWVYNAIFGTGPMYAGYGPTYASYGYAPSPYSASYVSYGYAPAYSYASSYAPVTYDAGACCPPACPAPCDPCAACPGGVCPYDVAPMDGRLTPQPDGAMGPPPTYLEDEPPGTNPSPPPADDFRRRAPQQEQNEDVFDSETTPPQADFGARSYSEQSDSFKLPESVIEQRRPAPSGGPDIEGTETNGESLRIPPLGFDDKITWRAAPERTRLAVAARYATPVVARAKIEPNSGWTPVLAGTQLAKK